MSKWQPIKKAPKDGAWILAYIANYAGVDKFRAGMWVRGELMSAANFAEGIGGKPVRVTHWQSLPKPPQETI